MSTVDDVLKTVGEKCTLIRAGGNIETHFYTSPKGGWTNRAPYERESMMPTDSGVVEGDLVQHLSNHYLVVALFEDRRVGEFFYYKARLYKCNSVVTTRVLNPTTKLFEDSQASVNCLIIAATSMVPEDMALLLSQYNGRDNLFVCLTQDSVGLKENDTIVDIAGRQFRVTNDIDPYFASGITKTAIKLEQNA